MTGRANRFIRELRHRRVFRVAVVYAIVAWIIVQVAATTFPFLDLPAWTVTLVIAFAVLGFPIALVLAWAFELTPEGVQRTRPGREAAPPEPGSGFDAESQTGSSPRPAGWHWVRSWPAAGLLLLGVGAGLLYLPEWRGPEEAGETVRDASRPASLAVLPFANLSGDPGNDPFVSGLHYDLLGQLSGIGGLAKVIPRTSVMGYADTSKRIPEIAAELAVAAVLEGGVQRVGNRVRIQVMLVEGSTERQLWAETYERELTVGELFDIQADIARRIANALATELTPAEERRIRELPTDNLEAYDLYLRAVTHGERWGDREETLTAIALLEQAVELDPGFAQAWAKISYLRNFLAWASNMTEQAPLAKEALDRAVELDPDGSETLWALGEYHYRLRDYERALRYFDEVDRLQANRTYGIRAMITRRLGRWEEAVELMKRQIELEPQSYDLHYALASYLFRLRDFEMARRAADRAIAIAPQRAPAQVERFWIALGDGDVEEARRLVAALPAQLDALTGSQIQATFAYYTREFDRALALSPRQDANDYLLLAVAALRSGDAKDARDLAEVARTRAEARLSEAESVTSPLSVNPRVRAHLNLAKAHALLGDEVQARSHAAAAQALVPVAADHLMGVSIQERVAEMLVLLDDRDAALERLDYLLSIPSNLSVGILRLDPLYDSLRDHPGFNALLAEYEAEPPPK